MEPNRNGLCQHCKLLHPAYTVYSCELHITSQVNPLHAKLANCPIYHAETESEALEALMLMRLTNAPK